MAGGKQPPDAYAMLGIAVRAVDVLTRALEHMTEHERDYNPLNDSLIAAVDALQARVADLSAGAPPDTQAAFNAALGDLLRVILERVSSMAATPTVLLAPRIDALEALQARMIEDIVHRLAAIVPVQALTERLDQIETRIDALEQTDAADDGTAPGA